MQTPCPAGKVRGMARKLKPRKRTKYGRVTDVRFMEVEFEAPVGTRMVIEVEGGLRLLVADDQSVELAARLLNALGREQSRTSGAKGGAR